jgi:hypothetical protein
MAKVEEPSAVQLSYRTGEQSLRQVEVQMWDYSTHRQIVTQADHRMAKVEEPSGVQLSYRTGEQSLRRVIVQMWVLQALFQRSQTQAVQSGDYYE